jgi:transcription initiation factor IIE alpha subunit
MATQQDLEQVQVLQSAEKLVSTVVRAFFEDEAVLVIDSLIRGKYLKDKDDDLGAQLGLQPKQVRAVLARVVVAP